MVQLVLGISVLTETIVLNMVQLVLGISVLTETNIDESKRKAMNRHWYNQKANPALNTKAGNK